MNWCDERCTEEELTRSRCPGQIIITLSAKVERQS